MTKTEECNIVDRCENLEKRALDHQLLSKKMMEEDEISIEAIDKQFKTLKKMKRELSDLEDEVAVEHFLETGAGISHNSPHE